MAILAAIGASVVGSPAAMAQTAPAITSPAPPIGVVGNGYMHLFQASSLPAPVFVVTAGSLPPGISLLPQGFLTGAPTTAGAFGPTTVCGVDDPAPPACQTFTITVAKRVPAILASPSAGGAVGTPVRDTASLVGSVAATGSVNFRLFSDQACTVEVFRSSNALSTGGSATSTDYTPTAVGTYRWTTSYGGDTNNAPASTLCDPSNSVAITAGSSGTTVPPLGSQGGLYHALPPARILDTRATAPVGPGGTLTQLVTGVGGVPATGVSAVVLNVAVTSPTAASFLTIYPDGTATPPTASLNFSANQTMSGLVLAKVGADGKVAIYNGAGAVHVILDVGGWFGADGATSAGGSYNVLQPARVLDTRYAAPVSAGSTIAPTVTGVGGVPSTGVSAVALNVTVTTPTAASYLTVYPHGEAMPLASSLNFTANQTVSNLVIAKVGADGKVAIYNAFGSTDVVLDVVGWFGADGATSAGGGYNALQPARLLDTRSTAPLSSGATITPTVTGVGGVPSTGVSAVALNVTVTAPTSWGFLTVYPNGAARPQAANVSFVAGQTVGNMVLAKVGADGKVAVYNAAGSAHVIIDVVGWYSA